MDTPCHLRRHPGVNVFVPGKCRQEVFVLGAMGQHPQFNLRVVGRDEDPVLLAWNEGGADFATFLRADRDVLQVGVAGTKPTRRRNDLIKRGMNTPRLRTDHLGDGVDVGVFQFRVSPVLQNLRRECTCWGASSSRTAASVLGPVFPFLITGRPSSSKRISWSCLGEPILKGLPAVS